jgi:hypothetical protein
VQSGGIEAAYGARANEDDVDPAMMVKSVLATAHRADPYAARAALTTRLMPTAPERTEQAAKHTYCWPLYRSFLPQDWQKFEEPPLPEMAALQSLMPAWAMR